MAAPSAAAHFAIVAVALAAVIAGCQPPTSATRSTGPTLSIVPAYDVAPTGAVQEGTVVRVSDGDTIEVEVEGRRRLLRYIGLDAPEIQGPYEDLEWLGPEAAQANYSLVGERTIFLEKEVSDTDRNGRLLRYVWLRDGAGWLMVNRELVRLGFAQARDYPPDTRYSEILFAAQQEAKSAGVGLWASLPANTTVPR